MRTKHYGLFHRFIASLVLMSFVAFGQAGRASAGSIIFVKAGAAGSNTGTSWANAYKSLQSALSAATSGQQIWVAKGTYKPTKSTDQSISFELKDGVAIYGGFAGTETTLSQRKWKNNPSILSGDIGAAGNASDNSYHVVRALNMTQTAILDGFTITKGNASAGYPDYWGAGLYNASDNGTGKPTLRNLVINNNAALYAGAGIFNDHGAPRLSNVTFSGNAAGQLGGGMYSYAGNAILNKVTFNGNSVSSATLGTLGGAMAIQSGGDSLTNVTFSSNFADGSTGNNVAGGLYIESSTISLVNVTFSNNTVHGATGAGGAIYNYSGSGLGLSNVTFALNSADWRGGAIYNNGALMLLNNVTASNNSAGSAGGTIYNDSSGGSFAASNSIFWGGDIVSASSSSPITDSIIPGSCPANASCSNVFSSNPVLGPLNQNGGFTKTMALGPGSPAIEAAGASTACEPKDQRGIARPQGLYCDMGAYEVKAKKVVSAAAYDGHVLESGKATNIGGAADSSGATLRVGDNAQNRRYRGILSFDTSALPDNSTVALALVYVRVQGISGDPSGTQGTLYLDVATPYFPTSLALEPSDYQAQASASKVGSVVPAGGGWYGSNLTQAGRSKINKYGTTQVRLYFGSETYNGAADSFAFYSGNASTATTRPLIWVYYNP